MGKAKRDWGCFVGEGVRGRSPELDCLTTHPWPACWTSLSRLWSDDSLWTRTRVTTQQSVTFGAKKSETAGVLLQTARNVELRRVESALDKVLEVREHVAFFSCNKIERFPKAPRDLAYTLYLL